MQSFQKTFSEPMKHNKNKKNLLFYVKYKEQNDEEKNHIAPVLGFSESRKVDLSLYINCLYV